MIQTLSKSISAPHFNEIQEPRVVALVHCARAGTKLLQSFLDDHENILMIPGYPLMYLYPHWSTWCANFTQKLSWKLIVDIFCEKHASVLDSRNITGLSGLERLGEHKDACIKIDEQTFRNYLEIMLNGLPIKRRTFLLAVHYAYGLCKQWNLGTKHILFYHIHYPLYLKELSNDFPNLKIINMIRNPRASLHSSKRAFVIVDQSKLNLTDSMTFTGRNFWLASKFHFDTLDRLSNFINVKQTISIKHENLHEDLEHTMKRLAKWLGIDFSTTMLRSTFDGKLWWGDVTNKSPVNGPDPTAMSDKWRNSFNSIDSFVIEGILYHFYGRYNYPLSKYQRDTILNRILLTLAILLPSKAEWQIILFYFNLRTHIRFLRAAIGESTGCLPFKDYTWSGTYLFKWTYIDLKLWRLRWYQKILILANNLSNKSSSRWHSQIVITLFRTLYINAQYTRFLIAVFTFPVQIFKRWRICYTSLWRRISDKAFLPPTIN